MKKILRITAIIAAVACFVSAAAPAFAAELYEKQVVPESSNEAVPLLSPESEPEPAKESEVEQAEEPQKETAPNAPVESKPEAQTEKEQETKGESEPEPEAANEPEPEAANEPEPESATEPEPSNEPDPEPKSLDELTDEEILEAGEKLLKDAIAKADEEGTDLDIIFTGEDLDLYLRYQEVKARMAARPRLKGVLRAMSAEAQISHIYALNSGDAIKMVNGKTQANPKSHAITTHVHYDRDTKNAVYCANINRHFVDSTTYDVAGQWESSEMYSALSCVFDNGVKKLNGLAAKKYSTGTSNRDWYATQMVIWEILHHYGIKDAKGGDAGLDIATTSAVDGFENVYTMMKKLYDDALYFASKQGNGNSEDPYFVLLNPDYRLILKGAADTIFFITSAEEPIYTLDVKGASMASGATVHLYKKNYTGAQQWLLEECEEKGYYYFKNANSNKYLEVENDGTANATNIQQNVKTGKDGQKWKMLIESDGTVEFAPKLAENMRIDIKSAVFVNGTNVQLYKLNGTKAQKFRCEPMDVQAKNITSDGKYVQTDWIDAEAKGDLAERTFSLENAPKGSSVVYEKANDPLSRVAVRVPIASIPANGKCEFLLRVNAVFNQPMISYLAINDATTQELLVAGNSVPMEVSDQISVYTVAAFGGVKIAKRDIETKETLPQGDASFEGIEIEIVNKTGGSVALGGNDLPIRCKVYMGMTESEEALLFAQQTGASAILGAGAKVRALIFGGDPEAINFMKDTESVGIRLDYGQQRGKARIGCIATALGEYRKVGPERYKEALKLIIDAWGGCPDSMRAETILGVTRFVDLYHEEYDPKRMVRQMKKSDPVKIFRDGHAMCCNMPGYKKYLYQVFDIYNGKSKKYALPMKF